MAVTPLTIRPMKAQDRAAWVAMRCALWPSDSHDAHAVGVDAWLKSEQQAWGFIAEAADGVPVGFAELAVRAYANGCDSQPVAFVEGIWVDPRFRRQGIGTRLIAHLEAFALARGFRELGSDTELHNDGSQAAHGAWGFCETERVVYFRKLLVPREG
jgi:aminoglycoside 6'-N-acetyltransferase I